MLLFIGFGFIPEHAHHAHGHSKPLELTFSLALSQSLLYCIAPFANKAPRLVILSNLLTWCIPYENSVYNPNYLQSKVMPQKFLARAVPPPNIEIINSENTASTFWLRAQNLTTSDPCTLPSKFSISNGTKYCGFCQACFHGVPETGDTKRIDHRGGLQALLRSARYCPLCSFFKTLVSQRCGESVFRDGHGFAVYTRKDINKQPSARLLLNVGFQVKGRCMVAMAFCPDSSK
jgi:hypothetical protein